MFREIIHATIVLISLVVAMPSEKQDGAVVAIFNGTKSFQTGEWCFYPQSEALGFSVVSNEGAKRGGDFQLVLKSDDSAEMELVRDINDDQYLLETYSISDSKEILSVRRGLISSSNGGLLAEQTLEFPRYEDETLAFAAELRPLSTQELNGVLKLSRLSAPKCGG